MPRSLAEIADATRHDATHDGRKFFIFATQRVLSDAPTSNASARVSGSRPTQRLERSAQPESGGARDVVGLVTAHLRALGVSALGGAEAREAGDTPDERDDALGGGYGDEAREERSEDEADA